jgi:low temperature requirement protein LtrA
MARDAFSLAHFAMICGVIAYAVAVEQAVGHPLEPLAFEARVSLAAGVVLFIGATAVAMWRTTCGSPLRRTILSLATGIVIVAWAGVSAPITLTVALIGILAVIFFERRTSAPDGSVEAERAETCRHIGGAPG